MVANTTPVYTIKPDLSFDNGVAPTMGMGQPILLAANDYTGVSANYRLVHTAGADGSYVIRLRAKGVSGNAATVARIFINNGSTNATASNNVYYDDWNLPLIAASALVATPPSDYPMELRLTAGQRIYVGLGTAVVGGWVVTTIAGQYSA